MPRKRHQSALTQRPEYRIFLSHATADKYIARAMCRQLDAAGAATFIDDRDIDGGDDIPDAIRNAIKQSHELVVLLTPNSANRPWVMLEVGAAWVWARVRIVAVLYNLPMDTIPAMMKSKKAIQLNDFESYVEEVAKRIKASNNEKTR